MPAVLRILNSQWFRILVSGTLLFFGAEQALKVTGNPHLIPTVIILGALVIPASITAFFYNQERVVDKEVHQVEVPVIAAVYCFVAGGVIGVATAGLLEYETLSNLNTSKLFIASFIEESTKLILPIAIYVRGHYRSEADGLLFGVASGMGFAAFETMGYGLVALINSQGNVGTLEEVLLIRGLWSPFGHAAWTGIVCATLWHQRERMRRILNIRIVAAFVLAVSLHAVWNISGFSQSTFIDYAGSIVVGGISLPLLLYKLGEARRPIDN